MSTYQPVNCEANLTFWPLLPIANESWSSGTTTSILPASSSITTFEGTAGARALITKVTGSSDQGIISIFSPCNSLTTAWTLEPLIPTHAPTGSILGSFDNTDIFALLPGSLATLLTTIMPSYISGTSCVNKAAKKSLEDLDKNIWAPLVSWVTSTIKDLNLSPGLSCSLGIIWSRFIIASPLPRSIVTEWFSTRLMVPTTISPIRSLYSWNCLSRSASLTFWEITCLAVCAAIRPKSIGGRASL